MLPLLFARLDASPRQLTTELPEVSTTLLLLINLPLSEAAAAQLLALGVEVLLRAKKVLSNRWDVFKTSGRYQHFLVLFFVEAV